MTKEKIFYICTSGILLAFLIICSQLTIPLPLIPLTLQTLAVGLIATLLPMRYALETIGAYLLLGALGLPVFANFKGGPAVFLSPTGGYLVGFIVYILVTCALLKNRNGLFLIMLANLCGAFLQLLFGSLGLMFLTDVSFLTAFLTGTFPFLVPGLIKVCLVVLIARAVEPNFAKHLAESK